MRPFDKILAYCEVVEEQIRWKKARPNVSLEIEEHLIDQTNAYIKVGDLEEDAVDKAILQMGNAEDVGRGLDASYRPKPQWFLLLFSVGLILLGAFLQLTCWLNFAPQGEAYTFRVMPFVLTVIVLVVCYFLDFTILGKHALSGYFAILGGSIFAMFVGDRVSGGYFLTIGNWSIPLTCLTLVYPLVFALLVYHLRGKGVRGLLCSFLSLLPMFLVLHLTTSASSFVPFIISATAILCFTIYKGWFGDGRGKQIKMMVSAFVVMMASAIWYCTRLPYRMERLMAFIDPMADPFASGYIYNLIRELMAGTQFVGKGVLPSSVETIEQMPLYREFMLSFFSYQFGWIVFVVVVALFVLFAVAVGKKVLQQTSILGTVVSLSIFLSFVVQTGIYFLYNLGYGLFTPVSLPFVSFGNTAMIVNGALVGFMLSVFRTGEVFRDSVIVEEMEEFDEEESAISFANGRLTIDFHKLI